MAETDEEYKKAFSPPVGVDILAFTGMIFLHFFYMYKLIDYSLYHLKLNNKSDEITQNKATNNTIRLSIMSSNDFNTNNNNNELDLQTLQSETNIQMDTIELGIRSRRRKAPKCCFCCLRCPASIITWNGTRALRWLLRFWVTLSVSLSLVYSVEFFGNMTLEFFITIFLKQSWFGFFALVIIFGPMLFIVSKLAITMCYHSVIIANKLSCDINGDLQEEYDTKLHKFEKKIKDQMEHEVKRKERKRKTSVNKNSVDTRGGSIHKVSASLFAHLNTEVFDSGSDDSDSDDNSEVETNENELKTEQERQERQGLEHYYKKLKLIADLKLEKGQRGTGDYFVGTCWRLWFFILTFGCTLLAVLVSQYNLANGEYVIGYLIRYCCLCGIIWSLIYIIGSFILSIFLKLSVWRELYGDSEHNVPFWHFFILWDGFDMEIREHPKLNKKCYNFIPSYQKAFMVFSMILLFVFYLIYGYSIKSGFYTFLAYMALFYYFVNLFVTCKPFSLLALLRDDIPKPGLAYYQHVQTSKSLSSTITLDSITEQSGNDESESDYDDEKKIFIGNQQNTYKMDNAKQERLNILTKRYENFKYKYIDIKADYFMNKLKKKGQTYDFKKYDENYHDLSAKDNLIISKNIPHAFFTNYKNYWLNVYRPFDEYNMDTADRETKSYILGGYHYCKVLSRLPAKIFARKNRNKNKQNKSKNADNNGKDKGKKCRNCCGYIAKGLKYWSNIWIVTVILALCVLGFRYSLLSNDKSAPINYVERNVTNVHQTYPICSEVYGSKIESLEDVIDIQDMLFLSAITYEMDDFNLTEMINTYFNEFNNDYQLIYYNNEEKSFPKYMHIINKQHPISFVAVRGTAQIFDMLQDMSLFVEVATWDFLTLIIPFLDIIPTSILRYIIYYSSLAEGIINAEARIQFTAKIKTYLTHYINNTYNSINSTNTEEAQLYIIGHSLGGAIAASVAAELYEDEALTVHENNPYGINIHSIGVNSPGTALSSIKFGYQIDSLYLTSTSVLAYRDLVQRVDLHGGIIQYIGCADDLEVHQCHLVGNAICEVHRYCKFLENPVIDCFCNTKWGPDGEPMFGPCLNATQIKGELILPTSQYPEE